MTTRRDNNTLGLLVLCVVRKFFGAQTAGALLSFAFDQKIKRYPIKLRKNITTADESAAEVNRGRWANALGVYLDFTLYSQAILPQPRGVVRSKMTAGLDE